MITWEPSTSVMAAPARSACERMTSVPAALSPVATTVHDGRCFQAGCPEASENAASALRQTCVLLSSVDGDGSTQ